jgi:hypothetical protein
MAISETAFRANLHNVIGLRSHNLSHRSHPTTTPAPPTTTMYAAAYIVQGTAFHCIEIGWSF